MPDSRITAAEAADEISKLSGLKTTASQVRSLVRSKRLPVAHQLPGRTGTRLFDRSEVERVAAELRAEKLYEPEGAA